MTRALQKKIRKVEEDHADELVNSRLETFDSAERDKAALAIGYIGAFHNISRVLSATAMRALIEFQKKKMHESLGFERFEHFLDKSPLSPMTKNQFYDRLKVLKSEGDKIFDTFNSAGISLSDRKVIAQNEDVPIVIEGDELLIGEERADLSDLPLIKALIKKLSSANEQFTEDKKKNEKEIDNLKNQIYNGSAEYDELKRNLSAVKDGSPFDQAQSRLFSAFIRFNDEIKELPAIEKSLKAENALENLWMLIEESRKRFGSNRNFHSSEAANVSDIAKQVFAEDDDFGDELEN